MTITLVDARSQADGLMIALEGRARRHGLPLSCGGVGCNGCCRASVPATMPEVDEIVQAMTPEAWAALEANEDQIRDDPQVAFCPLLDPETGGCSVYEIRPLVCRLYAVCSPKEWCWPERTGTKEVSIPKDSFDWIFKLYTAMMNPVQFLTTSTTLGSALLRELGRRRRNDDKV
jgi:Fe-S-cluster containining protein